MTCARLLLYTKIGDAARTSCFSDRSICGRMDLFYAAKMPPKNHSHSPCLSILGVNSSLKRHSGRIGLSGDGERGRPFAANAFRNRFRKSCDRASLPPECSAHGFRKAPATRFAEATSELEIRAITGHRASQEAVATRKRKSSAAQLKMWHSDIDRGFTTKRAAAVRLTKDNHCIFVPPAKLFDRRTTSPMTKWACP
jgi:hypothetical protein